MSYPIDELLSHPNTKLIVHLAGVLDLTNRFLKEKPQDIQDLIRIPAQIIAVTHDVGKATVYFQKYIRGEIKRNERTNHSFLSSVIAYGLSKHYLKGVDEEVRNLLSIFSFIAVYKHHSCLENFRDFLSNLEYKSKSYIEKQFSGINSQIFYEIQRLLNSSNYIEITQENIFLWLKEIYDGVFFIKRSIKDYIIFNTLFSILIDADRLNAGIGVNNYKRQFIFISKVLPQKEKNVFIDEIRDKAQREIDEYELNYSELLSKRIFSINLPTGAGKTIASLKFAFKLKQVLKEKTGEDFRIIYSLPFLSIVDQTYSVIENVLKSNNIQISSDILLRHHHLVEPIYKTQDDEVYISDKAQLLIESWNSEIIVTTFYQLFHTIFTNLSSNLKKFHKLYKSIIILDEIQALPPEYWCLVNKFFTEITTYLDCYIVVLTATEPYLFENALSLIKDKESYFKQVNRYKIDVSIENLITIDEYIESFKLNSSKRYLFVLNTIKSSQEFYLKMKKKYPDLKMTYLSTSILPIHKMDRINKIKNNEYKIVVSTQMVEAGVDIDFDVVVRDIAPLDCIVQSAGRCNRNSRISQGEVFVIKLHEEGKVYAEKIYNIFLLRKTEKLLKDKCTIYENEVFDLINKYFNEVKAGHEINRDIIKDVEFKDYHNIGKNFCIIKQDLHKIDLFVEYDDYAIYLWQKCIEQGLYNEYKNEFSKYVISMFLSSDEKKELPNKNNDLPLTRIEKDMVSYFYDEDIGFRKIEKSIFL